MKIKSLALPIIFVLGLVAAVSAQLPFNMFAKDTILPKQWKYYSHSFNQMGELDMLIADISATNTDVQLFAQFDRQPTSNDSWTFSYYQTIKDSRIFGRIFCFGLIFIFTIHFYSAIPITNTILFFH